MMAEIDATSNLFSPKRKLGRIGACQSVGRCCPKDFTDEGWLAQLSRRPQSANEAFGQHRISRALHARARHAGYLDADTHAAAHAHSKYRSAMPATRSGVKARCGYADLRPSGACPRLLWAKLDAGCSRLFLVTAIDSPSRTEAHRRRLGGSKFAGPDLSALW